MVSDWWSAMSTNALEVIHAHVLAHPEVEVGGFIIGSHWQDGKKPKCVAAIAADTAEGDLTRLTFTHDAWERVHATIEAEHPKSKIVGWYHSHPGHGIFLSGHDRFIHRHFFPAHYQVAVVVDPQHRTEGLFAWVGDEIEELSVRELDPPCNVTSNAGFETAFTRRAGGVLEPVEHKRLVVAFPTEPSPPPPVQPAPPGPAAEKPDTNVPKREVSPYIEKQLPPVVATPDPPPALDDVPPPGDAEPTTPPERMRWMNYVVPVLAGFSSGFLATVWLGLAS